MPDTGKRLTTPDFDQTIDAAMKAAPPGSSRPANSHPVLAMTADQARAFFLKGESYCRIELPAYFDFEGVLNGVDAILGKSPLKTPPGKPRQYESVNHTVYSNKDGRSAWRPFQLPHPVLYVHLLRSITTAASWSLLTERFSRFQSNPRIKCLSLPVESASQKPDKAEQILQWWQGIEQSSITLALDYGHVFHADITDCYASIYTHSIAWAAHGKSIAKAKRHDNSLIGNVVDNTIQDMQHGQTNGIPQGSVLFDYIAELVLGHTDLELTDRLSEHDVTDYQVLRYRDDYRIFVNNPRDGEIVLKTLSEVLIDVGLKLNPSKTTTASSVILTATKPDKQAWLQARQRDNDLQKHLLLIHAHGSDYPNGGSLLIALDAFYRRIISVRSLRNSLSAHQHRDRHRVQQPSLLSYLRSYNEQTPEFSRHAGGETQHPPAHFQATWSTSEQWAPGSLASEN